MILVICGSSGSAKNIYDTALRLNKWDNFIFINDFEPGGTLYGRSILTLEQVFGKYNASQVEFIISLGEPDNRRIMYDKIENAGYGFASVIHPDAEIEIGATYGKGCFFRKGVVVGAEAAVGDNVMLQVNVCLGHNVKIGSHSSVAGGVVIGGGTVIGESVYIGLNTGIRDAISVGKHSIIGMCSCVTKPVDENSVAYGNPAVSKPRKTDKKVF